MSVFIVPAASPGARANLEKTIKRPVPASRLKGLSRKSVSAARRSLEGVAVWGTQAGPADANVVTWEAMEPGDWVLFYSEGRFPVAGRVLLSARSRQVAEELWGSDGSGQTWEYLYLMDELRWIEAPRVDTLEALTYKRALSFYPRKFIRVARPLDPRYRDVEEMLADLAGVGNALNEAVSAASAGDHAAAAVAVDSLVERMSEGALKRAISKHTASAPPAVREKLVRQIVRDRKIVVKLKKLYEGRCQHCDFTFIKANGESYSEVAHLRAISHLEADLDTKDNLIVLCANHHRMLDFGKIEIEYDGSADQLLLHENGKTTTLVNKHIGPGRP
jgi:hypothetical protein